MVRRTTYWKNFEIIMDETESQKLIKTLEFIKGREGCGRDLMDMLTKKGKIYIEQTGQKTIFYPKGSGCFIEGSPRIFYNPNYTPTVRQDPTLRLLSPKMAQTVYIYHELVHCHRYRSGEFVEAKSFDPNACSVPNEEFPTVGLYEYSDYTYCENNFRNSLHLPRRPFYFTKKEECPDEYGQEVWRRMFLCLPDTPSYRKEELSFSYEKINKLIERNDLEKYIAYYFDDERKKYRTGYPSTGIFVPPLRPKLLQQ